MATVSKRNFTRGIFSPVVQARKDVDSWAAGARRLTNVTIMKHGGVRKRPGTWFVYELPPTDDETLMLPFTYAPGQSYVLLMGQASMKPMVLGGMVVSAGFGITGITNTNPGVVTAPFHGLTSGAEIYLDGISGMVELNQRTFTATVLDANSFSIGEDTTGYGTFTADDGVVRVSAPPPPPPPPTVPPPSPPTTPPDQTPPSGDPDESWGRRGRQLD